jgi:branched-chain amino acid transport system ATP-binding protein
LRAISGVIAPFEGGISWEGRDLVGMKPEEIVRMGIAHVPEGRRLFAGLTVRENLMMGAYSRKGNAGPELDWVVDLFPRLGERLDQVAGSLSGGEQQMCAIGRGLMAKPRLVLIDELSLGLAPVLVDQLLDRLEEVRARGTAVLLVEQDVDAALRLAARGYVLETGRIVTEGPGEELLDDPKVRRAYLGVA